MGLITETNKEYYTGSNYGGYAYVSIDDLINNFLLAYTGDGKMLQKVDRTDLLFFAKRALQELSYDTLKVIKSQELEIPPSLSLPLPQDYVNYAKISWIDDLGVKHRIYPTRLTSNPTASLLQDNNGIPVQDNNGDNITSESITENFWGNVYTETIEWDETVTNIGGDGKEYGLEPENYNKNGWFTINDREGKLSFSSSLVGKLIILDYISDGNAWDEDSKIPKLAEDAFYASLLYSMMSIRQNVQEYVLARLKREKTAKLRNAKIRISNIKLEEISQVMRNKSKIIKH